MEEPHATNLKDKLNRLSPISSECCIYRVPKRLRDKNEKAYTPQVFSLGPLHHGREGLKAMEEHKMRYVKDFFERTKVSLQDCFKYFKEREARIRSCYAVTIEFNEDELVEMILVDGIFTLEVMLKSAFPTLQMENNQDHILGKPWMDRDILYDMLMLENQIPFFILEYLYSLAHASNTIPLEGDTEFSLIKLTHNFLQDTVYIRSLEENLKKLSQYSATGIKHFVDFALKCHRPYALPPKRKPNTLSIPSATRLREAGVKFRMVKDKNLFDIQFENGILEIPQLQIRGGFTSVFFRNLIAYEQFEHHDHYINDYVFIIEHLVNNKEDVELLVRSRILESKLSDSKAVATFINTLDLGPILFRENFYFTDLCENLNDYHRVRWNKWKASLKQDYFSTPWVGLSVIGAAILFLFTVIQGGLLLFVLVNADVEPT